MHYATQTFMNNVIGVPCRPVRIKWLHSYQFKLQRKLFFTATLSPFDSGPPWSISFLHVVQRMSLFECVIATLRRINFDFWQIQFNYTRAISLKFSTKHIFTLKFVWF